HWSPTSQAPWHHRRPQPGRTTWSPHDENSSGSLLLLHPGWVATPGKDHGHNRAPITRSSDHRAGTNSLVAPFAPRRVERTAQQAPRIGSGTVRQIPGVRTRCEEARQRLPQRGLRHHGRRVLDPVPLTELGSEFTSLLFEDLHGELAGHATPTLQRRTVA